MNRPEDEAFLEEASRIVSEPIVDEERRKLQLRPESAKFLEAMLRIDQVMEQSLQDVMHRPSSNSQILSEESMHSLIRARLQVGMENPFEDKVSVDLTDREALFLSDNLAESIVSGFQDDISDWEEGSRTFQQEVNLGWFKDATPAFKDLSQALLRAGVAPHPFAYKLFDDLPQPQQEK